MPKLELNATAHYLTNSLVLAHLSDAAYSNSPEASSAFKKTVFESAAAFSHAKTETQGFVTGNDSHVVLAFRGSQEPKDWLTNLNFKVVRATKGVVHEGFNRAVDAVFSDVVKKIKKAVTGSQTLWVTGHSLGGALATLAAQRLIESGIKVHFVATFGQPRVGDGAYAQAFKPNLHRFVNNKDIVPTVPPRVIPISFPPRFYSHTGELEFFDKNGKLTTSSGLELGILADLQDALGPLSSADSEAEAKKLILAGMEDHKLKNYIACIEKNAP